MEEQTYHLMGKSGGMAIAMGIVSMVTGIVAGVLLVISGAKLIAGRKDLTF